MKKLLIIIAILSLHGCLQNKQAPVQDVKEISKKELTRAYEYYNKGLEHNLILEHDKALPYYDSAIMITHEAMFFTNRGTTKSELGDPEGALEDYLYAIELDSTDFTAISNIGCVYLDMDDYETALAYFRKSESQETRQAHIYYRLGYCMYMLGDYDGALKNFERHLKSDHNNHFIGETFYLMGNCHEKLGELPVSKVYWDKAKEIGFDEEAVKAVKQDSAVNK